MYKIIKIKEEGISMKKIFFITFIIVISISIPFTYAYEDKGSYFECNSCDDCWNALNDNKRNEVRLVADIFSEDSCIITAVNFTNKILDCQGHKIVGSGKGEYPGGYLIKGITVEKSGNIIKNCIITGYGGGISLIGSKHILINNTLISNWYGIIVDGSNHTLINNTVTSISPYPPNVTSSKGSGIMLRGEYNTLINNTVNSNARYGIYIYRARNNILINNIISSNGKNGIYSEIIAYEYGRPKNNKLINNIVNSNGGDGISLFMSDEYALINNTINSNGGNGIELFWSDSNILIGNVVEFNQENGLFLLQADRNLITSNIFCFNNQAGGNYSDIHNNGYKNNGNNNTGDTHYKWNDTGINGFTYPCKSLTERKERELLRVCKEEEVYNPEIKECVKKGVGCTQDKQCFEIYKNESVICSGVVYVTSGTYTPGHCCLKGEIWNGTHCEEKKLKIVAIPYRKSWGELGLNEEKVREGLEKAMEYFPISKEKVKVIVWDKVCAPLLNSLWPLCPSFVGALGNGDRYMMIGYVTDECGADPHCYHFLTGMVIVSTLEAIPLAHELGHTFGLKDEYCHWLPWVCGTEAYPNPLREEYGCRVFPLPYCKGQEETTPGFSKATLEVEKQEISPCEWVKVAIRNLEGNACELYVGRIEELRGNQWTQASFDACFPGELCYISYKEEGTHKIRAKLIPEATPRSPSKIYTNEVEVNVKGSCKEPKLWGKTCSEDKLTLSLNNLPGVYYYVPAKERPIWFKVVKNNIFRYGVEGNIEIYDENCNKIETISGEKKLELKNGIYNFKVSELTSIDFEPVSINELGFCCSRVGVPEGTCLGNKAISGGGRSIMGAYYQTAFSQPAWEHLKKVMKEWEG
jgi:parallel beta-helix repeat protein